MDDDNEKHDSEVSKELFIDGFHLTLYAVFEIDCGWFLTIQNDKGVNTNWTDCFPSAEEAIDAGLKAINEEGVGEFVACDDFAYLYDGNNT